MSRRETPKAGSRLQKPGTSISRTNQSQITKTDSGTKIAGTSRISQTTIRPPGSRRAGPSNVAPPAITGAAKIRMAGGPSTTRPQSALRHQQVTQMKLSGLPGKPVAKVKSKTDPTAKGKAGTCPPTCSNQRPSPGPFTAQVEAGKHVPPGFYFHPMKGRVSEHLNSPEKLRAKIVKNIPSTFGQYKLEFDHPFRKDLAPLRKQHPDILSGHFRSFCVSKTDLPTVEQFQQQKALNKSMNPYMPENEWTVGLREAMDLEQGEMETEDGLVEYEQSTIDKSIDGQLGSPGRHPKTPPEGSSSSPQIQEITDDTEPSDSNAAVVPMPSSAQDYISPPREHITRPETHYNVEQRTVSPVRIDSPRGPIEAKQTFHIERQMGASPHGAVVDTTVIGTRTISPGQAEQIEITKRDRIPPPRTQPSASKRQSQPAFAGSPRIMYPSPPDFQPSPDGPQYPGSPVGYSDPSESIAVYPGSPDRYPSPPQYQPSPERPHHLRSPVGYSDPSESMAVYPRSPDRYPSPPQFQPSPGRPQHLGSPVGYSDPSESMAVYPGSPGRYPSPPRPQSLGSPAGYSDPSESMAVYPGSPERYAPQLQASRSPGRVPNPPVSSGSPTRVPSPPISPGSPTRGRTRDSPVSFDLPGSPKSPSAPGGPLDISIPVPSNPADATIDVIQDLVDEERIDFQTSATLSPQLQDKLDRIRAHSLLVETLLEIVPGDDVEESRESSDPNEKSPTKSDVLASMMYSEERGVIDTGSSPKKTYNALFGANAALAVSVEGERSITVSPAAPAPLQDIVVPVGQADVDDIAVISTEMSEFVASTEEMPKGDAYSSSIQDTTSPTRIPVAKTPKPDQSGIAFVDEDGEETKYIPRGELEEQKAPWDIDLDSLEDLVGGQMSLTSPMRSDESIRKTMGRLEYILDLERPKHYSCVQLRGTQRPPWFPGYFYVMPHTGSGESSVEDSTINYVKQGNDLERVFAEAWNIFKPQTVEGKSEVVLL